MHHLLRVRLLGLLQVHALHAPDKLYILRALEAPDPSTAHHYRFQSVKLDMCQYK